MRKIKVGVIGVGNLGQHHARIYANSENCQLLGVVDINKERAQYIAKQYKTSPYYSHLDLLDKVEAVSVVVPTVHHYEIARAFLEKGVHCLVEKPFTITAEEAEELVEIARRKKLVLQDGHIEHFNVAVQKLKEIVDQPMFIETHRLGGFQPRVKDIGAVLDLMIHDIDIVLRIVNQPIKSIEAVGVPVLTDKEDIANARITFANGCIANINVSRVAHKDMRKIRVFQKDTYLSLDYRRQFMDVYRKVPLENPPPGMPPAKIVHSRVRLKKVEPLKLELDHFLQCVATGVQPLVDGKQALSALQIAIQISNMIKERWNELNLL